MEYRLRTAQLADRKAMYDISCAAHDLSVYALFIPAAQHDKFSRYYQRSWHRQLRFFQYLKVKLSDPDSRVLVAEAEGAVVGYTLAGFKTPNHLVLNSLFIDPRYQGQGIGGALLAASFADLPERCEVTLEVLEKNKKAQNLYLRYGFRVSKRLDKYFFGGRLIEMSKY